MADPEQINADMDALALHEPEPAEEPASGAGSNLLRKWRRGELNTCEPLHAGAK